jgi:hypothetical protein
MPEPTSAPTDLSAGIAVAPAAAVAPEAAPAAPAAPVPNPVLTADLPTDKLKDRLDQTRRTAQKDLLSRWGAEKPEEIEAKLKRLAEIEASQLSEAERMAAQLEDYKKSAERGKRSETLIANLAEQQLKKLPEEQQAKIVAFAGDDPLRRFEFLSVLGVSQELHETSVAAVAPAAAPTSTPATTAPPGKAPPPGVAQSKYEEWQALAESNPIGAGIFLASNRAAIEASRPR